MASFSITPYQSDDLGPVLLLLYYALPAEAITESAFARKVLLDPNFEPNGAFIARSDTGAVVGFLLALVRRRPLEDAPPDDDRGWITLFAVADAHRRQGIGSALFTAAEAWLRAQDRQTVWISPYAPNYWTPGVDESAYPDTLTFLQKRGYETVLRPLSMDASLVGWRVPEWIKARQETLYDQGIAIHTFSLEWIVSLNAFLQREFPGDWQRYLRETMLEITAGRRPADELWLAVEDGAVVGFAQCEGERFGPFGVAKAMRGRGVGAVLLYRALDSMRQDGHHNAWFLWTDDATADRLYKPVGFRETRRYAVLRKNLDGAFTAPAMLVKKQVFLQF